MKTFTSGNDFLNRVCQNMDGCILLDVRMPEISGLELQKRLNDSGCKIPIIFMSGHQDTGTREESLKAGAIAFLQKPFEDQLLIETIHSALNRFADKQTEMNHEES